MIKQTSGNLIAKGVSFVSILMLPAILSAGAFDGAYFWCRGALDKNNDGYPDQGDFIDALHVGDDSYYGHKGKPFTQSTEPERRLKISIEEVIVPATCKSLGLHQCLKFTQPIYDNGGTDYLEQQTFILTAALNSEKPNDATGWAFYLRFRPDGGVNLANDSHSQVVFNYYNNWSSTGGGAMLWLRGSPTNGYLSVQMGSSETKQTEMSANQYYNLCTNKWTDVLVTKKDDKVDVYCIREGGRLFHKTYDFNRSEMSYTSNCLLGSYDLKSTTAAYNSTTWRNFRGSIRDVAVWNRALSETEALEVIFPTGTEKFRLGTHNGSSLEFSGKGSPTVDADSTNGWQSALATIGTGQSLSVKFDMAKSEIGLDEKFLFAATPESAAGVLILSINGLNVGAVDIIPGKTVSYHVRRGLLSEGENVLKLENESDAAIVIDSISFGGSWQLLEEDNSSRGGAGQRGEKNFYLSDTNLVANLKTILHAGPKVSNTNLTFHFTIPADYAASMKSVRFDLRGRPQTESRWVSDMPNLVYRVIVNGVTCGNLVFPNDSAWTTASLAIPGENISEGENMIRIENATPRWYDPSEEINGALGRYCWIEIDCCRFEVKKDPKGFVLNLK